MTKLEKNVVNAIDDAVVDGGKVAIDGAIDEGKCFFVKHTPTTLSLYWGEKKVISLNDDVYTALATKIFEEYIKF